jgi:uncharacterized protein (TIGR00266 family)
MIVDLACQPAYALAYVRLEANEALNCENGAMVAMSAGVNLEVSTGGGVISAAFRKTLGQESFFLARYRAAVHGAWVAVAPTFPGDISVVDLHEGFDLLMQTGAFLASSETIDTNVRIGGIGTLLQKEGLTVLKASGEGTLIICSYGGLQRFDLGPGEKFIVDTGHLVAWPAGMGITIGPLASAARSAISGEFLVAELTGPGTVFIQTRAEQGFKSWINTNRAQNKR